MIRKRDVHDCVHLFELIQHPTVFPYVRQKASCVDEFMFMTKQLLEEEEQGKVITRTITDDYGMPIGTINLFDIQDNAGFLGTWIGQPFQGLGFNQKAKMQFLEEVFFKHDIQTVFLRINKNNERSIRATEKLPYTLAANESHPTLLQQINTGEHEYVLYKIPKDLFYLTMLQEMQNIEEEQAM